VIISSEDVGSVDVGLLDVGVCVDVEAVLFEISEGIVSGCLILPLWVGFVP